MFWILMTVFVIGLFAGIVLPLTAVLYWKVRAALSGKKITCRQIFERIGY